SKRPAGRSLAGELCGLYLPGPQPGNRRSGPFSLVSLYRGSRRSSGRISRWQTGPPSHARKPSQRSNAAKPRFGRAFRPSPMMARSNCPLHICKGELLAWNTAEKPNLPLYAAKDPSIVRWYQEDQVINIVRSDPLKMNAVSEMSLKVRGELSDAFDGNERVVAVVIQRPYMRQVFV